MIVRGSLEFVASRWAATSPTIRFRRRHADLEVTSRIARDTTRSAVHPETERVPVDIEPMEVGGATGGAWRISCICGAQHFGHPR
jgi:hypothetical protein